MPWMEQRDQITEIKEINSLNKVLGEDTWRKIAQNN